MVRLTTMFPYYSKGVVTSTIPIRILRYYNQLVDRSAGRRSSPFSVREPTDNKYVKKKEKSNYFTIKNEYELYKNLTTCETFRIFDYIYI